MKIAINGFGRIGRMTLRALQDKKDIEVVAINDLTDTETLVHLLRFDSAHGRFPGEASVSGQDMQVNGRVIRMLQEKDPARLPWKELGVGLVIESTGRFTDRQQAAVHLQAGAEKVLITAPATGGVKTIVHGVNDELIGDDEIYSTASCTTNGIAPVLFVLDREFGIESGYMATVHAFTADQKLHDAPHKDLRRARAASFSIIPTTTGAARAIGDVLPSLKGRLDGYSYRVPVIDGSVVDLSLNLVRPASSEEINATLKRYAETSLKGIMEYSLNPLVSADILGNPHSSIVDALLTKNIGRLVKVVAWYDNEVGISNRIAELATQLGLKAK